MDSEDLDEVFGHINLVEDTIAREKEHKLREYVIKCMIDDEYCSIDDYNKFLKDEEE